MIKSDFYIRCKKGKSPYLDLVKGYRFDTEINGKIYKMGVHNDGLGWTVTELSTGFRVAIGSTREWALFNWNERVKQELEGTDKFDTKIDQCITKYGIANEV